MKILHVCSNYFPAHGGPQYTMKNISEKLVEFYRDDVEVITSNSLYAPEMKIYKKVKPSFEIINNVSIYRFNFRRWHYFLLTFINKIFAKTKKKGLPYSIMKYRWGLDCKGIKDFMDNTDADVIMATTAQYNFCDYPFFRFRYKNPKPFVLYGSIHLHYMHKINSPLIKRAKACDIYIANTEFEKNKMITYGVHENKIITVGTGVDVDEFLCDKETVLLWRQQNNIAADEILIAHIGRLSKGKGTELLLNAFANIYLENKKVKLLLAGTSTEYVQELKEIIENKKLPVILVENFDNKIKPILFNAMDIFVLASKGESFGVVFLEAWACRKPVVAANLEALSTLIDKDKNGFLFESGNEKCLSQKLTLLINNKNLREQFGNGGYQKASKDFNWKIITEKYRQAYLMALQNFHSALKVDMINK